VVPKPVVTSAVDVKESVPVVSSAVDVKESVPVVTSAVDVKESVPVVTSAVDVKESVPVESVINSEFQDHLTSDATRKHDVSNGMRSALR